jgi:hypothetical protein
MNNLAKMSDLERDNSTEAVDLSIHLPKHWHWTAKNPYRAGKRMRL